MSAATPFDLLRSPIEGIRLIEASAGTGKTFAITRIYLRLILERQMSVNEILVVTFTEAATAELKDRILTALKQARDVFSGQESKDPFFRGLRDAMGQDRKRHLDALDRAIRDFDEAAVFTIHGFCRRMLHDHAFESGALFDTELVTDQRSLIKEIVEDFWRKRLYDASRLFVAYVLGKSGLKDFMGLAAQAIPHPDLLVIPQPAATDAAEQEAAFLDAYAAAQAQWSESRDAVRDILKTDPGLNRKKYGLKSIPAWIAALDDFFMFPRASSSIQEILIKFTASAVNGGTKKKHAPPSHPFFHACESLCARLEDLCQAFDNRLLSLKMKLLAELDPELQSRKISRNICHFDDLLRRFRRALNPPEGDRLAGRIRKKFKAALIDEFQDTDPVQYDIFKNIFMTESTLFLIGDPKQAIYGFRGADIFVYMRAVRRTTSPFTLNRNWRSEPGLITAVNALFLARDLPFVYPEIPFSPVAPPEEKKTGDRLIVDGKTEPPFQFRFLKPSAPDSRKPIKKDDARARVCADTAAEISRLVRLGRDNRALIGNRPLREADLAVLTRTNMDAVKLQEKLSALNVPSVLYSAGNVFDAPEASEIQRILAAAAAPHNENLIRAALVTAAMGVDGETLYALSGDEKAWEAWIIRFRRYHDIWAENGFMRMFKQFLSEEKAASRLMAFVDGERRVTNFFHLAEILHQTWIEKRPGMQGLVKWLSEQRDEASQRMDEHQLRLESDENAVTLITVHRSKGLEYPVVFCPFTWDAREIKTNETPVLFHDASRDLALTLDLGTENIAVHRDMKRKESLAEDLRLLYVALTRAKTRCCLAWGRINQAEYSAPAYLFHDRTSGGEAPAASEYPSKDDDRLLDDLHLIAQKASGNISVAEPDETSATPLIDINPAAVELACRNFTGAITAEFAVTSFSSLAFEPAADMAHRAEMADHDAEPFPDDHEWDIMEDETAVPAPDPSIFSFPRGAGPGTFLHAVFEHIDFTVTDPGGIRTLVTEKLHEYGFDARWTDTIRDLIQNVTAVRLDPDQPDFRLSAVPLADRLNELEFYFPLKRITPHDLKKIFSPFAKAPVPADFPEYMGRLQFAPVKGFMKGYIDMVFRFNSRYYIVDWKSNHMGNRPEDYRAPALAEIMKKKHYILQYHIYAAALDRYLRLRMRSYAYSRHFGGVYYLFLRGMVPDAGTDSGVFFDRPDENLISELSRHLVDADASNIAG